MLLLFNWIDFYIYLCNKICDCDFFEVCVGMIVGGMFFGKFCGSDFLFFIYVNGSDMWLCFVSNKFLNNKGFCVKFEVIRLLKGMLFLEM